MFTWCYAYEGDAATIGTVTFTVGLFLSFVAV